jgi:hypothetical protein
LAAFEGKVPQELVLVRAAAAGAPDGANELLTHQLAQPSLDGPDAGREVHGEPILARVAQAVLTGVPRENAPKLGRPARNAAMA